jgi:5-methylcytosine-specific restriction endonuclease McrA
MSLNVTSNLQKRLEEADDHRCAYCLTSEANTGQPMTVDHILPISQGGDRTFALPVVDVMNLKVVRLQQPIR